MRSHDLRTLSVLMAMIVTFGASAQEPAPTVGMAERIGKNPIMAWTSERQNLEVTWDEITSTLRRILPETQQAEFDDGLRMLDEELGLSIRDDLLALVGPEMGGSIDLPPIDTIVGLFMANESDGLQLALSRSGLVTHVRQREQLNRSMQHLFDLAGATLKQEAELMGITIHPDPADPDLTLKAYYGFKGDFMALGFSPDWVRKALRGYAENERLGDGADYQFVRQALDSDPEVIAYLNLPRLQRLLGSSQIVKGGLASQPETSTIAEILFDESLAGFGAGFSTQRFEDGVRRTTFGPRWMGGATQTAILAAIAIPNMQNAIGRGRQKRTMADMRTLATAIEAHKVDSGSAPTTDGQWLEISSIEEDLSPVYLRSMPTTDAWEHAFLIKSDGQDYWIVSPGADGELSTDWSTVTETHVIVGKDHDLAYSNGEFLTRPVEGATQ